jgi:hypothetical protein
MDERQEIGILAREISWSYTEELMHPAVPRHCSAGEVPFKCPHSRRMQREGQSFKQLAAEKRVILCNFCFYIFFPTITRISITSCRKTYLLDFATPPSFRLEIQKRTRQQVRTENCHFLSSGAKQTSPMEMQKGLRNRNYLGNRGDEECSTDPPIARIQAGHRRQNGCADHGCYDAHDAADRIQ